MSKREWQVIGVLAVVWFVAVVWGGQAKAER